MDAIAFEVIRNALVAATDEMVLALRRSAYSTNIKTRSDFSSAFFDAELRSIAQGFAQPVHLGSMVEQVPKAILAYGRERLGPGDMLLTNDPYPSGVHLNDVSLIAPVHVDGELTGYVANIAHHVDVGGGAPASIGAFRAQIRSKHETSGDMRAQIAANTTGARRVQALVERHGREAIVAAMGELLDYTERRTRAELAQLPHGSYEAEGVVDNDGYTDEPVKLKARVTLGPDGAHFDTTGSDPQRRAPVNSTYAMTFSACAYMLGGWETHDRLVEVLFRAVLPALPERIPAGTKGMMCQAGFGSLDVDAGTYTCFYETFAGGYGGRWRSDGPDAVQAHGQNTENAPIEETELNYPVRIGCLALVPDSEGAGRFRGGLGLRKDYVFDRATTYTILADRDRFGPWGAFGGEDAKVAEYVHVRNGTETRLGSKVTVELEAGDVISVRTCGGGGYGPPSERDPELVRRDVREGKVSAERARDVYGVAI